MNLTLFTDEQIAFLAFSTEQFSWEDTEFTDEFRKISEKMQRDISTEYERRKLHFTMFEKEEEE